MTLKEKFNQVRAERKALLATNFYNFETLTGVVLAAKELNKPLILQLTKSTINYMGLKQAVSMAREAIEAHKIEAWLHLDHGDSYDLAARCISAGFDSIMIDASEKPFEDNVLITRQVVDLAHRHNICVEAELGYVAKLGQSTVKAGLTEPEEARAFISQTGVDSLAVAIGSAHGFYKEEPRLDLERLSSILKVASIPLVLHGGSGIPDEVLRAAVLRGICKVNLATEIKNAFMRKLKDDLQASEEIDLRKVFPPAIETVKNLVRKKLQVIC